MPRMMSLKYRRACFSEKGVSVGTSITGLQKHTVGQIDKIKLYSFSFIQKEKLLNIKKEKEIPYNLNVKIKSKIKTCYIFLTFLAVLENMKPVKIKLILL